MPIRNYTYGHFWSGHNGLGHNGHNHDNYGCMIEEQDHYGPHTKEIKKKNSFAKKVWPNQIC